MTKYAEEVRKRYREWLIKPRRAAEILKERGDVDAAELILKEIKEIDSLIDDIHGGMYAPETPADKMHIHFDIIERSALLDVHEKLRPIYAELNRLEREQNKGNNAVEPTKQNKKNIFQKIFGRQRNKSNKDISDEEITSYTDRCVKKYDEFKRSPEIEEHLIGEYYKKFLKPEEDEYKKTFLGLLKNLQTESTNRLLTENECVDWIKKGISSTIILKYKEKVNELKKFQDFKPDSIKSNIIRKALLETFYNPSKIYEQIGRIGCEHVADSYSKFRAYGAFLKGDRITEMLPIGYSNTSSLDSIFSNRWDPFFEYCIQERIVYGYIKESKSFETKVDGRFFQFANRVSKNPNKEIKLLLSIADSIIHLEELTYISDKEKQQALIDVLCGEEEGEDKREAFNVYFQIKDLYEGFKNELPREYEEAKKQTAESYAMALTEIKNILAELIKMKQDFYSKTPEEIERLYGEELVK